LPPSLVTLAARASATGARPSSEVRTSRGCLARPGAAAAKLASPRVVISCAMLAAVTPASASMLPDAVLSRPVEETTKGTIAHLKAPRDSIARAAEPARPACIVFPLWEAGAAIALDPLPKARAFMQVADNSFNYQVLGARGFAALGRLIDASDAYTFRYSNLHEAMALFERLALGTS